jgi:hypothetical protein
MPDATGAPGTSSTPDAPREKFKHSQVVATTSITEAIEIACQEAYDHYGAIGTDVMLDADPTVEIMVRVRGSFVPHEGRREEHNLKSQVDSQRTLLEEQRRKLAELQAQLPAPTEPSP